MGHAEPTEVLPAPTLDSVQVRNACCGFKPLGLRSCFVSSTTLSDRRSRAPWGAHPEEGQSKGGLPSVSDSHSALAL